MTHEAVALGSGIQRAYYTQIENGSRTPSVVIAKRIAECLEFDWTIFFDQNCSDTLQNYERLKYFARTDDLKTNYER